MSVFINPLFFLFIAEPNILPRFLVHGKVGVSIFSKVPKCCLGFDEENSELDQTEDRFVIKESDTKDSVCCYKETSSVPTSSASFGKEDQWCSILCFQRKVHTYVDWVERYCDILLPFFSLPETDVETEVSFVFWRKLFEEKSKPTPSCKVPDLLIWGRTLIKAIFIKLVNVGLVNVRINVRRQQVRGWTVSPMLCLWQMNTK